jgi:hypothetical protein
MALQIRRGKPPWQRLMILVPSRYVGGRRASGVGRRTSVVRWAVALLKVGYRKSSTRLLPYGPIPEVYLPSVGL